MNSLKQVILLATQNRQGTDLPLPAFSRHPVCHQLQLVDPWRLNHFVSPLQRGFRPSDMRGPARPMSGCSLIQARLKPADPGEVRILFHRLKPVADEMPAEGRQVFLLLTKNSCTTASI